MGSSSYTIADADGTEWPVELSVPGLVPPGLVDRVRGGVEGVVRDGGAVDLDGYESPPFQLPEDVDVKPGTALRVTYCYKAFHGQPVAVYEQKREQKKQRQSKRERQEEKARARAKARKRRLAEEFWDRYEIPFDYTIARKGRRSELLKGSSGTGVTSETVNHLFAEEAFEAGRLRREADSYVCDPGAEFSFTDVDKTDSEGGSYLPPVTCKTCLKRMTRWETETAGE